MHPTRLWLNLVTAGVAMVVVAMIVVALVLIDKPHFGDLVGPYFLQVITSGVMVGAILVLIGAWKLPDRTWRRRILLIWALVALTSPAFGIMFLLPWGALVAALPWVVAALWQLHRAQLLHNARA
jgi:hypothetical protein